MFTHFSSPDFQEDFLNFHPSMKNAVDHAAFLWAKYSDISRRRPKWWSRIRESPQYPRKILGLGIIGIIEICPDSPFSG